MIGQIKGMISGQIQATVRREMKRLLKSRQIRLIAVVIPLLLMLFFVLLLRNITLKELPIALCDEDHTPLSRQLTRMVEAAPAIRIAYEVHSTEIAQELLRDGQIWGFVLIPRNFERHIYEGVPATLCSYLTGTNLSANGALQRDLQLVILNFSASIEIEKYCVRGLSTNQAMSRVQPIRLIVHPLFNPTLNYAIYLGPSFLAMMFLLSVLLTSIWVIGDELRQGTAAMWYSTAKGSLMGALIGKLIPYTGIHLLVAQLMFLLLFLGLDLPLEGSLWRLQAATLLLVLSYQAIGLMLVSATRNLRLALSLGGGYGVAAFSFSGLTFPISAMYPIIRGLSHLSPFTAYTKIMIGTTLSGTPTHDLLPEFATMTLFLLTPLPFMQRLHRALSDQTEWGRS